MSFELDFLMLRRPRLDYVSPPVCEVVFSSTGVVIILDPINPLGAPTGLQIGGPGPPFLLTWDDFPNKICYNVYKEIPEGSGIFQVIFECVPGPEIPFDPPEKGCYKVSAITPEGESELSEAFCVTENAPSVDTEPATDVQEDSAILNGIVNPGGSAVNVFFEWGLTTAYGNNTPFQLIPTGITDVPFDDLITGLLAQTTYHFRAVATNGVFTALGGDEQFTTPGGGGGQTVTVLATSPDAFEIGEVPGVFTIFRTGDTTNPVTVNFTLGGTAIEGADYEPVGTTAFMAGGVTQVDVVITPINNFVIGPDLSVVLTLAAGDYAIGVPNSAIVTIHQAEASAPCSLFEDDDTSFGTRAMPVVPGTETWTLLPLGVYQWSFVDHVYQRTIDDCPLGCEATYGIVGPDLDWSTTIGDSGSFPTTSLLNEACCGGGLTGFSSKLESTAIADYHTKILPSFGNLGFNGTTISASVTTTGVDVTVQPTSPEPVFELIRTLQLIDNEPDTVAIENLASFTNGRFVASYNGSDSAPIALNASAVTVQAALNLMPSVIADGGVTCAGTLAGGMTVTWNVNGARTTFVLSFSTVTLGYGAEAVETTPGSGGTQEVQTFTVAPYCANTDLNAVSPEWDGATILRDLNLATWQESVSGEAPATFQVNGFDFANFVVKLVTGPEAPVAAATAAAGLAGNVDAGAHSWKIVFVSLVGASGGSPVSNVLVLGGASQVNLTNIPIGPAGTTSRQVYRTLAGGGKYYFVDTISNNVDTVYTDDIDDATIFNSGFGTLIKPASCFWACSVQAWGLGGIIPSTIWTGVKLTGLTPVGTYQFSENDYTGGSLLCALNRTDMLSSINLTGTF